MTDAHPTEELLPAQVPPLAANVPQSSPAELAGLLRWRAGTSLAAVDAHAHPGFEGGKADGNAARQEDAELLSDLQERLIANWRAHADERRVLLVIQGRDTAGKGGIVKHVAGALSPHGVKVATFGVPTAEEKRHHYLWRIRKALPEPGQIGVFDRSHYEDILAARMHRLVEPEVWQGRYREIAAFEAELVASGISVVKVMLTISPEEQYARLAERLRRADKLWKFSPGDIDDRARWRKYTLAFQDVLDRTDHDSAPWYVVPADRKWYARWAVSRLLIHHLEQLQLDWPPATFDREEQLSRLAAVKIIPQH